MGLTDRNEPQSFEEMAANEAKEEVVKETTEDVVDSEPQTDAPVEPDE